MCPLNNLYGTIKNLLINIIIKLNRKNCVVFIIGLRKKQTFVLLYLYNSYFSFLTKINCLFPVNNVLNQHYQICYGNQI